MKTKTIFYLLYFIINFQIKWSFHLAVFFFYCVYVVINYPYSRQNNREIYLKVSLCKLSINIFWR